MVRRRGDCDKRASNICPNVGLAYISGCSFIECCVHCCGSQMFHVDPLSAWFMLLSLFVRIVWSQSILSDRRPMFVFVSFFLFCRSVFLLWLSAEYHNVLMCSSLCGPHNTNFLFFRVFSIVVSLHQFYVIHQCLWCEKSN